MAPRSGQECPRSDHSGWEYAGKRDVPPHHSDPIISTKDFLKDLRPADVFPCKGTIMKLKHIAVFVAGITLGLGTAVAQPRTPASSPPAQDILIGELDFPGGTPQQFIDAIQNATTEPLNAIVPEEHAHIQLPPLKMRNVSVTHLFEALKLASTKLVGVVTGISIHPASVGSYKSENVQTVQTAYGFERVGRGADSVWYFRVSQPAERLALPVSRFYQLARYLEPFQIEDITTAIKTGWELLGVKEVPTMKFHPETKLLIAAGRAEHLQVIDLVLSELEKALPDAKPLSPAKPAPSAVPKKDGDSTGS
jgi:hypothetical protein